MVTQISSYTNQAKEVLNVRIGKAWAAFIKILKQFGNQISRIKLQLQRKINKICTSLLSILLNVSWKENHKQGPTIMDKNN